MELYEQKKRALQDTLALLGSNLDLARQQLDINEQLYVSQDVSSLDVMDAQARVSEAQNNFIDAENKYLREALEESAQLETELAIALQQSKERQDVFSHTDVRAPVAGVVKHLSINTLGGVLRQGDELMQISPTESELVVEVRIEPMDVGQLELGLPVNISLDWEICAPTAGRLFMVLLLGLLVTVRRLSGHIRHPLTRLICQTR